MRLPIDLVGDALTLRRGASILLSLFRSSDPGPHDTGQILSVLRALARQVHPDEDAGVLVRRVEGYVLQVLSLYSTCCSMRM